MKTEIFSSYKEFLAREDKSVNGVSKTFADEHLDYAAMNESNAGCWNCTNCNDCTDCTLCNDCANCTDCTLCDDCANCTDCVELASFKAVMNGLEKTK